MPALSSLLTNIPVTVLGDPLVEIRRLCADSRQAQFGDLFACLPGTKVHGHQYLSQVVAAGVTAVLVEDAALAPAGVTTIVAPDSREALAYIAAAYYGHPADALTVVGVTGTNGKTTVTMLLYAILRAAGHPTGLIGTLSYRIGDQILQASHTTPQAPELQAILAQMCDAGMTHAVMEVSSHALCQHRVTGVHFQATAFTNLTQDHLDYHQTMESYREAKVQLFSAPRYQPTTSPMISVFNADDPATPYFVAQARGKVRCFGLTGGDYQARDVVLRPEGSTFRYCMPTGEAIVSSQLVGSFNVSNALAALALAAELGVPLETAVSAVGAQPPVDGRFQRVAESGGGKPTVVVDYAHTPDGLEKVLSTAAEIAPGHVVALFGCGGDRDRGKRPQMAAIAARWARDIIITSDNPRNEDPEQIIHEILAGLPAPALAHTQVLPDRREAIQAAIEMAAADDLVVLAGKGHETYQEFADKRRVHFDDREEAMLALSCRLKAEKHDDSQS